MDCCRFYIICENLNLITTACCTTCTCKHIHIQIYFSTQYSKTEHDCGGKCLGWNYCTDVFWVLQSNKAMFRTHSEVSDITVKCWSKIEMWLAKIVVSNIRSSLDLIQPTLGKSICLKMSKKQCRSHMLSIMLTAVWLSVESANRCTTATFQLSSSKEKSADCR